MKNGERPRTLALTSKNIIASLPTISNSSEAPSYALPPHLTAWRSLVSRSVATWDVLAIADIVPRKDFSKSILEGCHSLDEFLDDKCGNPFMLWFFQKRSAFMLQTRMKKWSRDKLDDYVLLRASRGFVTRLDCFFVSYFWRTPNHSDPDEEYLRLHQAELASQTWSYIWVDWTCMPQSPRLSMEEAFFHRCLRTMSGIIRDCGFVSFYPPFEPRLWILYEIAECVLTCVRGIVMTSDTQPFLQHIDEMFEIGVQTTLVTHGYRCSFDRDRQYLTSWWELLVLLKRLNVSIDSLRAIMDNIA